MDAQETQQPPDSTAKPKDKHRATRWGSLMGGGALDYGSTLHALGKSDLAEGNPIMAKVTGSPLVFGAVKFGTNAGMGLLLNKMAKKNPKLALTLALLAGGVQAGLGIHNLRLASKHK
jgi:hypothetical protein